MEKTKKLEIQAKKYKSDSAVVSARLPLELVKQIDEISEVTGRTRNEIILMCLEFALENIVVKSDKDE